jgi:hypothetical protein
LWERDLEEGSRVSRLEVLGGKRAEGRDKGGIGGMRKGGRRDEGGGSFLVGYKRFGEALSD